MIDNLYMDKLKGRITESEYDRYYTTFRDQLTDITIGLSVCKRQKITTTSHQNMYWI